MYLRTSLLLGLFLIFSGSNLFGSTTYYVNCETEIESGSGTSRQDPWGTIREVNLHTFEPGNKLLFKRGTTCLGQLSPKGSGQEDAVITLGAYGVGKPPVIDGEREPSALYLFNQEYWHIKNLEVRGGTPHGILVTGDEGLLRGIHLTDLTVHGGSGTAPNKRTALLAVLGGDKDQSFEDVLIQGVTAYDTSQWAGIVVDGGAPPLPRGAEGKNPETLRAHNVTVRNCLVHDVGGDGIILFRVENGLIEKSVAWNTGMMHLYTDDGPKNPNAIWSWNCHQCTVQFTEGFQADTAGVDGGVYDIDWGSADSTIQYNYGHDSQGYCLSVFGAGGTITTNSTVRYNLCVNNGRSPRLAKRQGDIYLSTWGDGSLDGVQIYNNTVFWNPPTNAPAVKNEAEFVGDLQNSVFDNLILSKVPTMVDSAEGLEFDSNIYWYEGAGSPRWKFGEKISRSLESLENREKLGRFVRPGLQGHREEQTPSLILAPTSTSPLAGSAKKSIGKREIDVIGANASSEEPSVGAFEVPSSSADNSSLSINGDLSFETPLGDDLTISADDWALVTFLELDEGSSTLVDEQAQTVFSRSLEEQFGPSGLEIYIIVPHHSRDELVNRTYDWNLQELTVLIDSENRLRESLSANSFPTTFLIDPELRVRRAWNRLALPAELGMLLRSVLGPPPGHAPVSLGSK